MAPSTAGPAAVHLVHATKASPCAGHTVEADYLLSISKDWTRLIALIQIEKTVSNNLLNIVSSILMAYKFRLEPRIKPEELEDIQQVYFP
jgi:hypothetical protein